MKFELLAFDLL